MGNCICKLQSEQEIQSIITENFAVESERTLTPVTLTQRQYHRRINSNASTASFFDARGDTSSHESPSKYTKEVQSVLKNLDIINSKLENEPQPLESSHNPLASSLCLSSKDDIQQQLEAIHQEMAQLLLQVEQLTRKASETAEDCI